MGNTETKSILAPTEEELEQGRKNWLEWEKNNQNNFSKWYNRFVGVLPTPFTVIVAAPEELLPHLVCENCETDIPVVEEWVEKVVMPEIKRAFGGIPDKLFMKNGCFSNKFDFAKSCLLEQVDTKTIAKHIFNIEEAAMCFDTCGDLEFVFREWIEPMPGTPTIYNGMPLRPELRVFYDFDNKKLLYDKFYWDWEYCFPHIEGTVYEHEFTDTYPVIFDSYINKRDFIMSEVSKKLALVQEMKGIWSVDFLINETGTAQYEWDLWMIDAADAWQSAYWNPEKAGIAKNAG
jgi:hypothetical protein